LSKSIIPSIVPPFAKGFSKIDSKGDRIHYRHAVPDDAEPLTKLYDRVYKGGYPLKDCLDPAIVKKIIEDGEHIWMVALDGDDMIGATVSMPESWNRSYETCRSVTDEENYKGRGIGTVLYDLALHAAFNRDDCDLTFGYPRSLGMKHLMEKPNPPITVLGTDFGRHLVSGVRETHLFSVVYNPFRTIQRVINPDPLLSKFEDLEKLVDSFGLVTETGSYPERSIVGPKGERQFKCDHGTLSYNYFAPSRCAQITNVEAGDEKGMVATTWSLIQNSNISSNQAERIEHVSFYLLADKKELLSRLVQPFDGLPIQRFYISGYVPAWHAQDGKRYDCLHMATRLTPDEPRMFDTEEIVVNFHTMYNTKRSPIALPSISTTT
jgi:hypothetical protein